MKLARPFLLLAGLVLAGCASHRPKPSSDQSKAAPATQPVRMTGSSAFFAGRLAATVSLTLGPARGASGSSAASGHHGHRHSSASSDDDASAGGGSLRTDSPMPPVTLHLKFQNHSTQTLLFGVVDFESDLGNFVVHPEVLSLTPGQTGEPDAMTSQLGVTADEIPVKLTISMAGKTETQTIAVKVIEDPALSEWPGLRE